MPDDISTDSGLERLKLWIGLGKFFIGTVAMGAVTLFLNHQIQRSQITLEEDKAEHAMALQDKETEFEYLGKFITHAMNEDLNIRIQLADYMRSAALSENIRGIWSRYHGILVDARTEGEAKRIQLRADEQKKATELAELSLVGQSDDSDRARQFTRDIQGIRKEISIVEDQLDRQRYGSFEESFFDFDTLLRQAEIAKNAGHYRKELDLLLEAYSGAPESVHYYVLAELANGSRALRDFDQALLYMEQAVAIGPPSAYTLIQLAIMQKNTLRIDRAVETLRRAEAISSGAERLKIQLIVAGYLIHAGNRQDGLALYDSISDKLNDGDDHVVDLAWFYAVAGWNDKFYDMFERALALRPRATLFWADQEVDIDKYREEQQFKDLLVKYDQR